MESSDPDCYTSYMLSITGMAANPSLQTDSSQSYPIISIPTIFLWALVQALKVESPPEQQAMSDFPQVWFHFARQALIGSLRIIRMIKSSFIYFPNMAQDRERAFVCCCCCHRH